MKTTKTNNSELGKRSAHTRENTTATPENQSNPWRGVFFNGPHSKQDRQGKEKPQWRVYLGYEDGKAVFTVYHVNDFTRAESLANAMSRDRNLELIAEAQPA